MAPDQIPSAADKRAARRARVLQGSKSRLQLVTGEISTLKPSSDESNSDISILKSQVPDFDGEVETNSESLVPSSEPPPAVPIPFVRVDQAQRRRDAAVRRRQKEKNQQEESGRVDAIEPEKFEPIESVREQQLFGTALSSGSSNKRASSHGMALKLFLLEEKLVLLLIIATALYAAVNMDVSLIMAKMARNNELVNVSYDDLLASGVPMESIRQQLERGHVPSGRKREKLEHLLNQEQHSDVGRFFMTGRSGWLPDVASLGDFLTSLMAHPPVVLCVFLVRLLVSTGANALHKVLELPEVKRSEESDLGFVVNMALSGRPMLKVLLCMTATRDNAMVCGATCKDTAGIAVLVVRLQ
uniref:Uncharacterized protein n=1 Tax=Hyaloperonospora arabidopsidis (strain Emoy2) TaxID=559515 RepID=M4BZF2_HYAAE